MSFFRLNTLAAIALGFLASQSQAASVRYFLDQSNSQPDGTNYAQVTLSDSGDDIDISVDVIESAFDLSGASNFGMQSFAFNYNNALDISSSNIVDVDPYAWSISEEANAGGGFGRFEFELSGNGNSRTTLLSFTIADVVGDSITDYAVGSALKPTADEFFAAHIAGFGPNGNKSAQFAGSAPAPVPVPAAAWFMLSALATLTIRAKRQK